MNINGCLWCGHLERGHGQRFDGLHPRGAEGYKAPSTALRKWRLMLNISIRQAKAGQGRVLHELETGPDD